MASKPLFRRIGDIDAPDLSGMKKGIDMPMLPKIKIFFKIILPTGEIKTVKKRIKDETVTIDGKDYFFHSQAVYKDKRNACIFYYYGNPKPLKLLMPNHHIVTVGLDLKRKLKDKKVSKIDSKGQDTGELLDYQEFQKLPDEQKLMYSGAYEINSEMLNRVLDAKLFTELFKKEGLTKKSMVIIVIVVVVIVIIGYTLYSQGKLF